MFSVRPEAVNTEGGGQPCQVNSGAEFDAARRLQKLGPLPGFPQHMKSAAAHPLKVLTISLLQANGCPVEHLIRERVAFKTLKYRTTLLNGLIRSKSLRTLGQASAAMVNAYWPTRFGVSAPQPSKLSIAHGSTRSLPAEIRKSI